METALYKGYKDGRLMGDEQKSIDWGLTESAIVQIRKPHHSNDWGRIG